MWKIAMIREFPTNIVRLNPTRLKIRKNPAIKKQKPRQITGGVFEV
jgi:hypothetical protein